jgi:hypothetical protein
MAKIKVRTEDGESRARIITKKQIIIAAFHS